MFSYQGIVFILNKHCNACCDHCFTSCGPLQPAEFDKILLKDYIDQASNIPEIEKNCGIVGGEVSLIIDEIIDVIEFAHKNRFKVSVTTNGVWGKDKNTASNILRKFQTAGVSSIELSVDGFHQKYVPINYINNILECLDDFNFESFIIRIHTLKNMPINDSLKGIEINNLENVIIVSSPCLPFGRAKQKFNEEDFFKYNFQKLKTKCNPCLGKTLVTVDVQSGNVFPCCSGSELTEKLLLGNLLQNNLSYILKSIENDIFHNILFSCSPLAFLPILKENNFREFEKIKFVGICDACVDICNNKEALEFLLQYIQIKENNYLYQTYYESN